MTRVESLHYKDWELKAYRQSGGLFCGRAIKQIGKNKEFWFNVESTTYNSCIETLKRKIDNGEHTGR